jgi:hypothetical protein
MHHGRGAPAGPRCKPFVFLDSRLNLDQFRSKLLAPAMEKEIGAAVVGDPADGLDVEQNVGVSYDRLAAAGDLIE